LCLPLATEQAEWGYINLYREFKSGALLLDINYLCQLFQHEMAQAAERVLAADDLKGDYPELMLAATSSD
jgi:hypothetical protein